MLLNRGGWEGETHGIHRTEKNVCIFYGKPESIDFLVGPFGSSRGDECEDDFWDVLYRR
jgi:hypothetical protein